jgi:hypothetical protein
MSIKGKYFRSLKLVVVFIVLVRVNWVRCEVIARGKRSVVGSSLLGTLHVRIKLIDKSSLINIVSSKLLNDVFQIGHVLCWSNVIISLLEPVKLELIFLLNYSFFLPIDVFLHSLELVLKSVDQVFMLSFLVRNLNSTLLISLFY